MSFCAFLSDFDFDEDPEVEHDEVSEMFIALSRGNEMFDDPMDQLDTLIANISTNIKSLTWEDIQNEVEKDSESRALRNWIEIGCPGALDDLDEELKPYWRIRSQLNIMEKVPMKDDRTIIPRKLRQNVLDTLHSAHQGTNSMISRASDVLYWPGFVADIQKRRAQCLTCDKIAPSQANLPPVDPIVPDYPFQHICMDHFQLNNKSYGIVVDRFSNWPIIYTGDAADDVCEILTHVSRDYGIPETVSTDGAQCYVAGKIKNFMKVYGIKHRVSSVANAHSNCRAELGVKTLKRMIRDNLTAMGGLDTAELSRALLQYKNTRDRDTGASPAELLLGRKLRDFLPAPTKKILGQKWVDLAKARETALADRGARLKEKWSQNVKELPELKPGDRVIIQNQLGNRPRQWHKTGVIYKFNGYDQYEVMVDGSRRITLRNRKFLRKIDRPEVKHFPDDSKTRQQTRHIVRNEDEFDDDEPEYFTPAQSPAISRANSVENLQENNEEIPPVEALVEAPPVEEIVEEPPIENNLPRRSARANKGQTTRYQDYIMQHLEASATDVPINLIDKEGEDIVGIINAAKDVIAGKGHKTEMERELRNKVASFWRPWLLSI